LRQGAVIGLAVKGAAVNCNTMENKIIKLNIPDDVKKKVKQRDCKHEWKVIESSDYTETWRCNKCNKYVWL
jgi:ubiquitin C-terminal hydrolase